MGPEIYSVLADLLMLFHFAFVVFVLCGGLLLFWRPWFIWLHLPAFVWGGYVEITGGICPLTPLEISLRYQGAQRGFDTSFVEHYILPLLYPPGLTREIQILMGISVLLLNLIVYAVFIVRRYQRRKILDRSGG